MPNGYAVSMKKKIVQSYQEQWQDTGISIDDFSKEAKIHHTTIRNWLRTYAPAFEASRRSSHKTQTVQRSMARTERGHGIQIESEWYNHEQQEFSVSDHPATGDALTPPECSQEPDLIESLRREIQFLRQQVAYWMKQDSVL